MASPAASGGVEVQGQDIQKQADALKTEGNELFAAGKYLPAIELYTRAIELTPDNAVLYSNRAFAHIKTEAFGSALIDAQKSIDLDKKFIKGYYRMATAKLALGKHKEALGYFRQVVKLVPNDKDARTKLTECEKTVKARLFEEAIAAEHRDVFAALKIDDIFIESSYAGPHLPNPITLEFVKDLIAQFKDQKKLHKKYVAQMLVGIKNLLQETPTLVDITVDNGKHFTVCGDTHGQFYDLCNIFELGGYPSEDNPYLFNGDFVDRGSFSVEVILTLFAFKLLYPKHMHLARGNHESKSMNTTYGFEGEVKAKYSESIFELFSAIFCLLPLAHVLNNKVLVIHGGLFSNDNVTLADIRKLERNMEPPDSGIMAELLWSDPQPFPGRAPSKRGVGVAFGPDVTERFLQANNLSLIVRSHEVKDEGYAVEQGGKVITIFSAPNYCDQVGNKGAYIRFEHDMVPKFTSYSAVPHPPMRPMFYANSMSTFGF
jgi:serine/threonine-protein phosphatase 5